MTTSNESQVTPQRAPVSRANKIAAARLYVEASKKLGEPVPARIQRLAGSNAATQRQQSETARESMLKSRGSAKSGRYVSMKSGRRASRTAN